VGKDPMGPAVTEVINEAMLIYSFASASAPKLNKPTGILVAIRGLKVGNVPSINCIVNRA
jgi:hypothetical protein